MSDIAIPPTMDEWLRAQGSPNSAAAMDAFTDRLAEDQQLADWWELLNRPAGQAVAPPP